MGGSVAGVVAFGALILIIAFWIRRRANGANEAQAQAQAQSYLSPQPQYPQSPPPGAPGASYPGTIPPTPGTADPFLTPMGQAQNLGVSYFPGAPMSSGASAAASVPTTQYAGLPEPQQLDDARLTTGTPYMPMPLHDDLPRPISMNVAPMQGNWSDGSSANGRPWSGFASGPPPPGLNANAFVGYTESTHSGQDPSRWSGPSMVGTGPAYANLNPGFAIPNPGYAGPNPGSMPGPVPGPGLAGASAPVRDNSNLRPPFPLDEPDNGTSTVYLPSSRASGYDDTYAMHSPPGSPPPPGVYGGMVGASGSRNKATTATPPPPPEFASGEKHVYRPSFD